MTYPGCTSRNQGPPVNKKINLSYGMTRWTHSSIARVFATPRLSFQIQWLRNWTSSARQPRTRSSQRSRLRFSPITAGKIDAWMFRLLMNVEDLLEKGLKEDALAICHEELTFASMHRNHYHDCYHRLIPLFTKHGDFEAAASLCNRMVEEGFVVPTKIVTVLLKSMRSQDAKHVQQIQAMLTSGTVKLDDLAFKAILDSMVFHNSSPEDLENAFNAYSSVRGKGWIAPRSTYGIIIKAHALAGQCDRAEEWLERYRGTLICQNQSRDVDSLAVPVGETTTDPSDTPEQMRQPQRLKTLAPVENPYMSVLMGYVKSDEPTSQRIEWLFECMRLDGIQPDINMCNMLIAAFSRWGWCSRAFGLYRSLLSETSVVLPDAYTFRHIFIMLNPRRRVLHNGDLPEDLTARQLFKEMIALERLRLDPRKPQPHKNLISTATFNCALGTFIAQDDYAAAWTVLSCFTRHHISPDTATMRNVILGLLRRLRREITQKSTMDDVIWTDRLLGERRSMMIYTPSKRMLADRLYTIGEDAMTEMEQSRCETYLKPSLEIDGAAENAIKFLAAVLRASLQASLGFTHPTRYKVDADTAIKMSMLQARSDMIPRGRLQRN